MVCVLVGMFRQKTFFLIVLQVDVADFVHIGVQELLFLKILLNGAVLPLHGVIRVDWEFSDA